MRGHDYKIEVKDRSGKPGSRYITAITYFAAREKANALAKAQGWTISSIHKKKNFFYKVQRGATAMEGTQSAYTREEVLEALKRIGGEKITVRREFEINSRAPMSELVLPSCLPTWSSPSARRMLLDRAISRPNVTACA